MKAVDPEPRPPGPKAAGAPVPNRRRYLVDVSVAPGAADPVDTLLRGWDEQVGGMMPIPPVEPPSTEAVPYRVRIRHDKIADAVIEDLYSEAIVGGTGGQYNHLNGRVVMHFVQKNEWRFANARNPDAISVRSGEFCIRYNDPPWHFQIEPATRAQVLQLPTAELRSFINDRPVIGSMNSPEIHLLMAYMSMVRTTLPDLGDAGVRAARGALVELVKGVLTERVVADEPELLPALLRAAKDITERRLLDADLAPAALARELNVSLRTLHRAFADSGEAVMSYVRMRRLERARAELATAPERPAISELAARWQFSDGSHFTRTFRQHYGETPTDYARRSRSGLDRPAAPGPPAGP